jgi:glycosyltransferase involved in cell wall biosynthesis
MTGQPSRNCSYSWLNFKKDRRIVLTQLQHHGGISAASNCALELARGDWVGFLDHDDVLEPDALFQRQAASGASRRGPHLFG